MKVDEVYPSLSTKVPGSILITGAITDHGRDHRDINGPNTPINRIKLTKGSFEVDTSALVQTPPTVDPQTCAFSTGFNGPITIVPGTGTGAYQGVTGTVNVTVSTYGILPRASDGSCINTQNVTTGVSWLQGSGTVSFS